MKLLVKIITPSDVSSSAPVILRFTFEYYPSGISTVLCHCTTSYEFLLVRYFLSILPFHKFWVAVNWEHRLPFAPPPLLFGDVAIRLILLKPLDIECRGHNQHFCLSQVLIGIIVRNTIPAPRWFVLSSTSSLDTLPMHTRSCISCSAFPWERYTRDTCVSLHFPFHWSVWLFF